MAGVAYVVNPRRRSGKRRTKRARSHRKVHRRRRVSHNPIFTNARRRTRRRRHVNARHHRRRARRNPSFRGLSGGLMAGLKTGGGVAAGAIMTNFATGAVIHYGGAMVPAALQSGVGKMALKIGVGVVALPMLLKMLKQPGLARNAAVGAWAVVVIDAYNEWLAPMIQQSLGFSDYETGTLSSYETGSLSGYPIGSMATPGAGFNVYGGGIYGEGLA